MQVILYQKVSGLFFILQFDSINSACSLPYTIRLSHLQWRRWGCAHSFIYFVNITLCTLWPSPQHCGLHCRHLRICWHDESRLIMSIEPAFNMPHEMIFTLIANSVLVHSYKITAILILGPIFLSSCKIYNVIKIHIFVLYERELLNNLLSLGLSMSLYLDLRHGIRQWPMVFPSKCQQCGKGSNVMT